MSLKREPTVTSLKLAALDAQRWPQTSITPPAAAVLSKPPVIPPPIVTAKEAPAGQFAIVAQAPTAPLSTGIVTEAPQRAPSTTIVSSAPTKQPPKIVVTKAPETPRPTALATKSSGHLLSTTTPTEAPPNPPPPIAVTGASERRIARDIEQIAEKKSSSRTCSSTPFAPSAGTRHGKSSVTVGVDTAAANGQTARNVEEIVEASSCGMVCSSVRLTPSTRTRSKRPKKRTPSTTVLAEAPDRQVARDIERIVEKKSSSMTCSSMHLVRRVKSHPAGLHSQGPTFADVGKLRARSFDDNETHSSHCHASLPKSVTDIFKKKERLIRQNTTDVHTTADGDTRMVDGRKEDGEVACTIQRPERNVFRRLDCCRNDSEFEQEVDLLQMQRQRTLSGQAPTLRVRVEQTVSVQNEERWRDTLQTILYEVKGSVAPDTVYGKVEAPKSEDPSRGRGHFLGKLLC